MLFHQAHPCHVPIPTRSTCGNVLRPAQILALLPHQMYPHFSFTAISSDVILAHVDSGPGSLLLIVPKLQPRISIWQVLNTLLRLQGKHTGSPSHGCSFRGCQFQLFTRSLINVSVQSKLSSARRGLNPCGGCMGGGIGGSQRCNEGKGSSQKSPVLLHTLP